jgi:hypothetical protein
VKPPIPAEVVREAPASDPFIVRPIAIYASGRSEQVAFGVDANEACLAWICRSSTPVQSGRSKLSGIAGSGRYLPVGHLLGIARTRR